MPDDQNERIHACQRCTREDLSLTMNGRVRSHTANGKRRSETNPHCPGGSDFPRHDHDYQEEGDGVFRCQVCEKTDPRPTGQEVRNAETAINSPATPDDVYAQAESVLIVAEEYGIRPCKPEDHRFSYADDGNDHSGSFCDLCGAPDDRPTRGEVINAMVDAMGAPPEAEDATLEVVSDAARRGVRPNMPTGTLTGGPNPHRPPLSTGSEAQDRARGIPAKEPDRVSSADDFMGSDLPEGDDSPRYFPARYDGSCDTCGADFGEGDMIRKSPDGGWEAEECCGGEIDTEAEQRPRTTAPQLPVRNGRYQGPHPETGKPTSFTRTTTYVGVIADNFALKLWEERMGAMGFVKRPDLLQQVETLLRDNGGIPYEVAKLQRERLNKIFEDAKLAAGSKDRARKGTILHKHTQEIDMGRKSVGDVPMEFRKSVNAYLTAMADSGLECIPDLIERSTSVIFGKRLALQVAGTFDRILRVTKELKGTLDSGREVVLKPGEYVIGDVKSGQDLSYAWDEIEMQESIYAHGVDENGIAVPDNGHWRWADLAEFGIDKIRLDVGIVMHMPYGETSCDLYFADLISGWSGAKICTTVSDRRARDTTMTPVREYVVGDKPVRAFEPAGARKVADVHLPAAPTPEKPTQPPVAGEGLAKDVRPAPAKPKRTWEDVAREVTTREEANKVWAEMRKRAATLGMDRINKVVAIMRETLSEKGAV